MYILKDHQVNDLSSQKLLFCDVSNPRPSADNVRYSSTGAQSGAAFPCPAGAFGWQMGLSDRSACERCPPGRYCGSSGLAAPSGLCSPG